MLLQSYTGKELFRILLDNRVKPIVLIAFTNHALDHMLGSILDANITDRIVRLGSRSTDERIMNYSLRNLEQADRGGPINRQLRREYAIKKKAEEAMYRVTERIQIPEPTEAHIKGYLRGNWREHLSMMYDPPLWIVEYTDRLWDSEDGEGEWMVQGRGRKGKSKEQSALMTRTYYGVWLRGLDIAFIQPPSGEFPLSKLKNQGQNTRPEWKAYRKRMFDFFNELDLGDWVPPIPDGNRPLVQLLTSYDVWAMSLEERQRLAKYWEERMRRLAYDNHLGKFRELRKQYEMACERHEAVTGEVRVQSSPGHHSPDVSNRGGAVCWGRST